MLLVITSILNQLYFIQHKEQEGKITLKIIKQYGIRRRMMYAKQIMTCFAKAHKIT
jgi:hypothetical protein